MVERRGCGPATVPEQSPDRDDGNEHDRHADQRPGGERDPRGVVDGPCAHRSASAAYAWRRAPAGRARVRRRSTDNRTINSACMARRPLGAGERPTAQGRGESDGLLVRGHVVKVALDQAIQPSGRCESDHQAHGLRLCSQLPRADVTGGDGDFGDSGVALDPSGQLDRYNRGAGPTCSGSVMRRTALRRPIGDANPTSSARQSRSRPVTPKCRAPARPPLEAVRRWGPGGAYRRVGCRRPSRGGLQGTPTSRDDTLKYRHETLLSQIMTNVNTRGTAMSATSGETASMNDVAAAAGLRAQRCIAISRAAEPC